MPKIAFMGAGSAVFAKNVLGDSLLVPSLQDSHIALYDIDATRLKESKMMLDTLNKNINKGRARISAHLGAYLRGGRRMEVELAVVQRLRVGLAAGGDVGERARGNGQRAVVPLHELGEREELLHTRGAGV